MNGGLSLLLGLNAYSFMGKLGVQEGFHVLCLLPLGEYSRLLSNAQAAKLNPPAVFSLVLLAMHLMLSVDVGDLEKLKYGYKGA